MVVVPTNRHNGPDGHQYCDENDAHTIKEDPCLFFILHFNYFCLFFLQHGHVMRVLGECPLGSGNWDQSTTSSIAVAPNHTNPLIHVLTYGVKGVGRQLTVHRWFVFRPGAQRSRRTKDIALDDHCSVGCVSYWVDRFQGFIVCHLFTYIKQNKFVLFFRNYTEICAYYILD